MKKNQYECSTIDFKNLGVFFARLSEEQMKPIKSEIDDIQKNFDLYDSRKQKGQLAGNIKRSYQLIECNMFIQKLLMPLVNEYDKQYGGYVSSQIDFSIKNPYVGLSSSWVNFQEKYEFNPIHSHNGILSFVIWVKIPYDMEDELKTSPGINSNYNTAGMFSFHYIDATGMIRCHDIHLDKSMENCVVLFPSKFNHCVYPFFSSDGYRISVSGNFKLKTD
jgi:hypothetical protein